MPKFKVEICGGNFDIEATDEDDARDQALDFAEVNVEPDDDDDDDDEEEEEEEDEDEDEDEEDEDG